MMTLDEVLSLVEVGDLPTYVGVFAAYGIGLAVVAWLVGLGIWFVSRFVG